MYHYIPKKSILRTLLKIRKNPYIPDRLWNFTTEQVGNNYAAKIAFQRYWEYTSFYSKTKLKEVPVNGVLLPIELFEEEKVVDK